MKKIIILTAIILGTMALFSQEARALGVGDEIVAGQSYTAIPFSKFQLTGMAEFVLDKRLNPDTGNTKMKFESNMFLFKPAISIFENMDIYAKVGAGKNHLKDSNKDVKVTSDTGPAYGGGLRANLLNWEDSGLRLGFDAQYLRFDTGIDTVTISGTKYDSVSGDFTAARWQTSLFLIKEFFRVTAYAGGDFGGTSVKYTYSTSTNLSGNNQGKKHNAVGVLAGLNIRLTDAVVFFTEGQFIDETSLSLGFNAKF